MARKDQVQSIDFCVYFDCIQKKQEEALGEDLGFSDLIHEFRPYKPVNEFIERKEVV
jgi:hypothetical protein